MALLPRAAGFAGAAVAVLPSGPGWFGRYRSIYRRDQCIEHHAQIAIADTPVVSERPSLATKSEALDQLDRSPVVRVDQGLDPMHAQRTHAVVQRRTNGLRADALTLVPRGDDVAELEPLVAGFAVMIVDHAHAPILRSVGDGPSQMIVGARGLAEPRQHLLRLRQAAAGREIPEPHGLRIAKARMQAARIARLNAPEPQSRCEERGKSLGL